MEPEWTSVSVLTPIFNGSRQIAAYKKSVEAQTLQPTKIVLYDDGSTDETWAALSRWADEDARVSPHRGDSNRGRGYARQKLLELADTEFVAWLDVDDRWHPEKLATQAIEYASAEATGDEAFILCSPYYLIDIATGINRFVEIGRTYTASDYLALGRGRNSVVPLQCTFGQTETFRRTGFDIDLNWSEDFDFFLRFLGFGGKMRPQQRKHACTVYYYNGAGLPVREIVKSHDYVYEKNASLWPDPREALTEKYVRRLRYILTLCRINGQGSYAEQIIEDCISNLDNESFSDDIRRGWKQVLNSYERDAGNYVRLYHWLANDQKKLACIRVDDGYQAKCGDKSRFRWSVRVNGLTFGVHDGDVIQDDLVFRFFVEGIQEIELKELSRGVLRRFRVCTLPGGMIGLLPAVTL